MRDKTPPREAVARRRGAPLERVKPLTLGDLAANDVRYIDVECEWCRHAAQLEVASLIAREGAGAMFREIVRRLRCSVCEWNQVEAWPVRPNQKPRHPNRPKALPPLDECRALLKAVQIDPAAPPHEHHAAKVHALMERWPDLGASRALFVVRQLEGPPLVNQAEGKDKFAD